MTSDFLGSIGGLEFVTGEQAFDEAAAANRAGIFGRSLPNDVPYAPLVDFERAGCDRILSMGTRVHVSFRENAGAPSAATLFGNSHHPEVDLEKIVRREVAAHPKLPSETLRCLLTEAYPGDHQGHRAGDPIFRLDFDGSEAVAEVHLDVLSSGQVVASRGG